MTDADLTTTTGPAARVERAPLSRRELRLVVAFWGFYAILQIANRVLDTRSRSVDVGSVIGDVVGIALVEATLWCLLTPVIFRLAARIGHDESPRAPLFLLIALVGVVIATGVGLLGWYLRFRLGAPPPDASGIRRGPPVWFGILNALVMYAGVLAAGIARMYSWRYRARREQAVMLQAELTKAQLEALRRQLDPHFLFNTLNIISSLVERDPRGARRMVSLLSELLRQSLEAGDEAEIPLRDELALTGRYLEIMLTRFQGRLQVSTRADDDVLDVPVPSLILQPLVENAIKHGIERRRGQGTIDIEARAEGDTLVLVVRDTGGEAADDPSPVASRHGVGVRNTRQRLQQLYGDGERFTLRPLAGTGMEASLRIPIDRANLPLHALTTSEHRVGR